MQLFDYHSGLRHEPHKIDRLVLLYVLAVGAVFVMRVRLPNAPRPYRAWGYPWLPGLYIVAAVVLMADLLVVKPRHTWPGQLIAASGVPIYALFRRCEIAPSGVQSVAAGD